MSDEPITLVIERTAAGGEVACVYYGRRPEPKVVVYQLRLDRLDSEHRRFWLEKSTREMLEVYSWLRDEGTLPPANLADPPRKDTGEKGVLRGEASWWKPPPRYWDPAES